MVKTCITCGNEFPVTKHQKLKKYCSAVCTKGYYHTANKKRKGESDETKKEIR